MVAERVVDDPDTFKQRVVIGGLVLVRTVLLRVIIVWDMIRTFQYPIN